MVLRFELAGNVPVTVWCNLLPVKLTDPSTGQTMATVMTQGLEAFIGHDLTRAPVVGAGLGKLIAPVMDRAKMIVVEGGDGPSARELMRRPSLQPNGAPLLVIEGQA